jgi:pyruvate-formate lyase-activating enzyme
MISQTVRPSSPDTPPRSYIHPQTLTILGTYKCTAMCTDCCFDSNPWLTQRLSLDEILEFIEEGARHPSVRLVVFSGGECFLLREDLVRAVKFAAKNGLRTRCVTNGYWARLLPRGRKRLQQLKDAGLSELNISTGDFHQRWVPEESVINAARLGVEMQFDNTLIVVEAQKERRVTVARLLENPHLQELQQNRKSNGFRIIESAWMPMDAGQIIDQPAGRVLNHQNIHQRHGCESVFRTIVVTPTKKIGFCCGLSRELIPELNAEWSDDSLADLLAVAGSEFMKIWLFVDGPERILAWAASKDPQIDWEGRYSHHCHACLALYQDPRVRRAISLNYRERVDDVLMRYSFLLRQQELLEGASYEEPQRPSDEGRNEPTPTIMEPCEGD